MPAKKKASKKSPAKKKSPARKKAKKTTSKKSPARRKSSKKAVRHGKTVASPTFGGKKFKCAGKKVRVGKKTTKVARVFCRRAEKAKK